MGTSCQAQKSERFKVVAKVSNSSHGKIYIANYHGRIVTIKIYTKNCNKAYSGKVLTYRTFQKRAHIIREIIPWDLRSEIFQFFLVLVRSADRLVLPCPRADWFWSVDPWLYHSNLIMAIIYGSIFNRSIHRGTK